MDSLCASKQSRFVREAAVNRRRLASCAPCRATHAQQQSTTQLFREAGRRVDVGSVALEPCVRFTSVRMHGDALAEHGGLAALDSEGGSINARFATPTLRPQRETSCAGQYRNELQDHGFKFTLNWAF
ncbi:UNVERIFIED_ORG: uncharacterized protein with beta-barrel porin domain [Variovorax paradoxus]|nr:uncharacterized protein with beta-barrel porin domain [Variovorax paradoxus]